MIYPPSAVVAIISQTGIIHLYDICVRDLYLINLKETPRVSFASLIIR